MHGQKNIKITQKILEKFYVTLERVTKLLSL